LRTGADPAAFEETVHRTDGGLKMGEVIRFPDEVSPRGKYVDANTEPATVIILPVIRIERDPNGSDLEPRTGNNPGRRRRRRVAR
jgi:hypothetical protein